MDIRKKLIGYFPFIFFFCVATLFVSISFSSLRPGEFIFSGDQLLRFSGEESFGNSYFIRKLDNFGVFNSWQQMVQWWDEMYYLVVYALGVPLLTVEKLSFFLTLFFSLTLSFLGFRKFANQFKIASSTSVLLFITLWYCFNPYTLVMWHGGVYNLGFALCYALMPFLLCAFHTVIFSENVTRYDRWLCASLMFFASFTFWLFAVSVFVLFVYTILIALLNRISLFFVAKRVLLFVLYAVPFMSIILFALFHEHVNNIGDVNATFVPSFGSQQGGLWYQFLMLFSWGIYTVWTPRALYPFGEYFFRAPYMLATIGVYVLAIAGVIVEARRLFVSGSSVYAHLKMYVTGQALRPVIVFALLLFASIFFAKGAQDPFGELFIFLYQHVPFFSVFRSADHRFGSAVVFSLAILLIFSARFVPKIVFIVILSVCMIVQSYPLFFGQAVRGENKDGLYYDRIVSVSHEYQEVADVINARKGFGYVLTLPSFEYGHYLLEGDKTGHHTGQDILPKIIEHPFVYLSESSGIASATLLRLSAALKKTFRTEIQDFPIRFIIVRTDIDCAECAHIREKDAGKFLEKILENAIFTVYEVKHQVSLIAAHDAAFRVVNPVRIDVQLRGVKEGDRLELLLSYSKHWKLFLNAPSERILCRESERVLAPSWRECASPQQFLKGDELAFLFQEPIFEESHEVSRGYANSWILDIEKERDIFKQAGYTQNDDGTWDVVLTAYYKPQSWFYVFGVISGAFLFVALSTLVYSAMRRFQKKRAKDGEMSQGM